jgi:hypothetical protein
MNESERGGDTTQRQSLPPQMIEKISLKLGDTGELIQYNNNNMRESNNLDLPITQKDTILHDQASAQESLVSEPKLADPHFNKPQWYKVSVPAQVILEEGRKNAASKLSTSTRPKTAIVSPTPE